MNEDPKVIQELPELPPEVKPERVKRAKRTAGKPNVFKRSAAVCWGGCVAVGDRPVQQGAGGEAGSRMSNRQSLSTNVVKRSAPIDAPKVERNLRGLVDALFDEIDGMRDGTGSAERVKQVCAIAGRINALVNTEIKFRKSVGGLATDVERIKAITG